jgi:ABC-type multidrug transport system permease subunit
MRAANVGAANVGSGTAGAGPAAADGASTSGHRRGAPKVAQPMVAQPMNGSRASIVRVPRRAGFCEQLSLLCTRSCKQVSRDLVPHAIRLSTSVFFALVLSGLYSGMDLGQSSIQDRNGLLFFISINQAFSGLFSVVNTFPLERAIVLRERSAGTYDVGPYYVAKCISELPGIIFFPSLFGIIVYWAVGLNGSLTRFLTFLVATVLTAFTAGGLGTAISACASSVEAASAAAPPFMIIMILFGGFYINADNVPDAVSWVQQVSFIRHCFEALCINEYRGLTLSCADAVVSAGGGGVLCYRTGDEFLETLDFNNDNVWRPIFCLALEGVAVNLLACALLAKNQPARLPIVEVAARKTN